MATDGVTIAFELMLDEIASVVSEVNSSGAAHFGNSEYDAAKRLIASAEKLAEFRGRLELLKDEWASGFDEATKEQINLDVEHIARSIASAPKSSKTVLVVKFADGTTIYENKAADSLVKALDRLGLDKVAKLGERVNNWPLVSTEKSPTYIQTPVGGYLVMTHSSTQSKRDLLRRIASALNERITVDIVPA